MSIIRLHNVTKRYDDKLVLREINLKLDPGDRVGLLGKNGSGKTTLLRLILARRRPTRAPRRWTLRFPSDILPVLRS